MPAMPLRMGAVSSAALLLSATAIPSALAQFSSGGCPVTSGDIDPMTRPAMFNPVTFGEDDVIVNGPASEDAEEFIPPLTQALYEELEQEIITLLETSVDFWPNAGDFDTYRGLLIRLAWHCTGSYRASDGRGGCDGGRIRYFPEFGWPGNVNLDKAIRIVEPLHNRYRDVISFADLVVLIGNVGITSGGGTVLGFCGGRQDDSSGRESLKLGPTPQQERLTTCEINGLCPEPLGPSTVGLQYVNPEGPVSVDINDPEGRALAAADDIRDIFGRMGFLDDRAVLAIIGGGHSFGRTHGACPLGAGPGPLQDLENPYPGLCGTGVNNDTFSSGFEGPWTTEPTRWTNLYFQYLRDFEWFPITGPGGRTQWEPRNFEGSDLEVPQNIMMLTTDIAFIRDPDFYELVKEYADDLPGITADFATYWYQLMTQDMGPVSRCTGPDVPTPQEFQDPLPDGGDTCDESLSPEFIARSSATIRSFIMIDPEMYVPLFTRLAYNCASTFKATSHIGGCNGARILLPPQIDFPMNEGLEPAIAALEQLQLLLPAYSAADLIVLAGSIANEVAGAPPLPFCGGRVDATDGGVRDLARRTYYLNPIEAVLDSAAVMGVTLREAVALAARPVGERTVLSNEFYTMLLTNDWILVEDDTVDQAPLDALGMYGSSGAYGDGFAPQFGTPIGFVPAPQPDEPSPIGESTPGTIDIDFTQIFYSAAGNDTLRINALEFALIEDDGLFRIVEEFSVETQVFGRIYGEAWVKLMNADRFDGPTGNLCTPV